MNLFYQVKNFMYNNLCISSIFGVLYYILSCRNIFWKKNGEKLTIYTSRMLETDNILSNSDDDDFEIISDEDDMD